MTDNTIHNMMVNTMLNVTLTRSRTWPLTRSLIRPLKSCTHECAAYALRHSCAVHIWGMVNKFSANLRRAKDTRCMKRTPGAYSSLCVWEKNQQILVRGEQYANHSQMVQHRFAVPSTHTHIWFTNHSTCLCIQSVPLNMQPKIYKIEKTAYIESIFYKNCWKWEPCCPLHNATPLLEISEDVPKHIGHNGVNFRSNTIFQCF